jgi:hypothetical protein
MEKILNELALLSFPQLIVFSQSWFSIASHFSIEPRIKNTCVYTFLLNLFMRLLCHIKLIVNKCVCSYLLIFLL